MRIFLALVCMALGLAPLCQADEGKQPVDPLDWPNWRGPRQDRLTRETGLPDALDFSDDSKLLAWKSREAGGISTPIVMRGKLYTIVRAEPATEREQEEVLCLDAATGKRLWGNRFNVFLSDVPAERVGWSCCVGDPTTGRVYAMGVNGYFQCLDGETGKPIWARSLMEEFGILSTYGGRTNVPVLFEDLVIISGVMTGWGDMARPAHRFLAMDKNTGEVVWFNGTKPLPEDTTYSTPMVTVIDGQAAMVFGSGDGGVYAFQPRTGKPIWSVQFSRRGINVSPLVIDDKVYLGQGEENTDDTSMGAIACLDGRGRGDIGKTNILWRHKEVMVGKSTPLWYDGRLYVMDDSAALSIFDADGGQPIGRKQKFGTIMRASLLGGDGKIYVPTNTTWAVLKPTARGFDKLAQGRLLPEEECQGSPIVSHGRLYWPTTFSLYCFRDPDKAHNSTPLPDPPQESPIRADQKPAQVQLVPCEVLLRPGDKQKFTVRLFNDRGQFLRESEAVFEVKGPGRIDSQGVLNTERTAEHTALEVTAKVGDLTGTARVRVVPPLPWKFDFADGEVPLPWVGARYRNVIRTVNGDPVMVKVTTIPKGTRSQSWMGQTDLHDYTIQADVLGNEREGKLPDMGLIAQRYTLDMMGASQQLQIRSWTSTLNRSKTIPFAWKPGVWYTMKFRATTQPDRVVLEGKVWERGNPEPAEWTISTADALPNLAGSPGLFGNATNAEIFVDNVSVTPNQAASSR
jgi:outer membrane protein assembly factor BamB